MVVAAKSLWPLLQPDALLPLWLAAAALLLWTPWRRLGRWLVMLNAVAMISIAALPVGEWLALPLEDRFPPPGELPARIDGVIVLGGSIRSAHPPPAISPTCRNACMPSPSWRGNIPTPGWCSPADRRRTFRMR
jgi:hypothetical protein